MPLRCAIVLGLTGLMVLPSVSRAEDPRRIFDEALQSELHGGAVAARAAFGLYQRAAETGLPEAEFNAAIMLDSGRGIPRDVARAATLYARAASHGHERAAYNLGQLYQAGEGVPVNADLARAWFSLSKLPAARSRLATLARVSSRVAKEHAPKPVAPTVGFRQSTESGGVELVWTAEQRAEAAQFLVEIRAIGATGTREVFSGLTPLSSIFAVLPATQGDFAWRVTAIDVSAARYVASGWTRFSLAANPLLSSK